MLFTLHFKIQTRSKVIAIWVSERRVSYNKGRWSLIFRYFKFFCTTFAFCVQYCWNLEQVIYTSKQKIWIIISKNIVYFWNYANFARKNCRETPKSSFFTIFSCKFSIKSKVNNIFSKILQIFCLNLYMLWSKFRSNWNISAFKHT